MRNAAAAATDLACRVLSRRQVVRAARFVLARARLDVSNDMGANGESSLQDWMMDLVPPGLVFHVIDVGANIGQWSASMVAAARRAGRLEDLDLHAFEPSACTYEQLALALHGEGVSLRRIALSDRSGSSLLHVIAPGAGTNSLHAPAGGPGQDDTEEVATATLDSYVEQAGLDHITLLKIDTEGHDLAVLRGARTLLAEQRIFIAQFEYNHRWVYARSYLRDVFNLLEPFGYRLGKLTPRGVEFYPRWDPDLETYIEGNYVACRAPAAEQLPSVTWWKSGYS
jgi:FkbM family methyltransferase